MKKPAADYSICLLALLLALLLLSSCKGKPEPSSTTPPLAVHVFEVQARQTQAVENVPGSVRAKLKATIEAKVSGRIDKMLAVEGQSVEQGQLLASLDVREIRAKLDQAIAVRDQAEKDLQRFTTLVAKNAVTRQEFEQVQARALVARASVTEAQTMLGYAEITAPFKGVITRKLADVGDLASPGRALIEMEDPAALRFEANIPETFMERIKIGQYYNVRVASLNADLLCPVTELSATVDPNSRTFLVKLDLPERKELRSGQYGHVAVLTGEESIITIPRTALLQRGQLELVYVVENGRAHLRLVRSGKSFGEAVQILSGLSPGELVVSERISKLRDGQQVEVLS